MPASRSTDRIEKFFHHLSSLKHYAHRVIIGGDPLSDAEEADKERRMTEFWEIGASFDLSDKEMVTIMYRELLSAA